MRQVSFTLVKVEGNFVYISDDGLPGYASVTNQAEYVVETLIARWGSDKRFFYRDSMFVWDELCHDGAKFTDFKKIDNREHEEFLGEVKLRDAG